MADQVVISGVPRRSQPLTYATLNPDMACPGAMLWTPSLGNVTLGASAVLTATNTSLYSTPYGLGAAIASQWSGATNFPAIGTGDFTLIGHWYQTDNNLTGWSGLVGLGVETPCIYNRTNILPYSARVYVGATYVTTTFYPLDAPSAHCMVAARRGGVVYVWADGQLVGSGTVAGSVAAALPRFGWSGWASSILNGSLLLGGIYPIGFTDAQCARISRSPWELLAPQTRRIWVPSAGGPATHTSTGALTADAATIDGTAGHVGIHPSTGALTAGSATTAGTAAHQQLHPSTGELSAQSATIAGTAGHVGVHPSTGALAADAAVVDGSASSAAANVHTATGALSADAATIAGTAGHVGIHPSTGALSADSATIDGTASAASSAHTSIGSLSADAATVEGSATHVGVHTATGDLIAGYADIAGIAVNGIAVPSKVVPAGGGRGKKRRRYVVEIDGEEFGVSSADEAIALLDSAREEAQKAAEQAVQRAAAAPARKARKVLQDARKTLDLPSITVPAEVQSYADQVLEDIRRVYTSALRDIEISAMLSKVARDAQDEEDVLLLMM